MINIYDVYNHVTKKIELKNVLHLENIIQGRLQLYNSDKYSKFEEFIFYFCQN